jgi:hypothetical protein
MGDEDFIFHDHRTYLRAIISMPESPAPACFCACYVALVGLNTFLAHPLVLTIASVAHLSINLLLSPSV